MATASASASRTRSRARTSPDAIALLKADHQQVEQLFKRFEGFGPKAHKGRESTVAKIVEALSVHAAIEETTFYPRVRSQMPDATDDVLEALEEHHVAKWTLSELDGMSSTDERYTAKVTVLMESIRHHVKEEERELFPKVRKAMSRAELQELGDELTAAKRIAPRRPHPRTPDTPPGNLIAAAVTAPIDAARAIGEAAVRTVQEAAKR